MKIINAEYEWAYPLTRRIGTELIVLHHEGADGITPECVHSYHQARGWNGIAYHYYVRRDGTIYAGRPEDSVGCHTGDFDSNSLAVCFEGDFDVQDMEACQLEAGKALLEYIRLRYPGIRICAHRDLCFTTCPGNRFPINELLFR